MSNIYFGGADFIASVLDYDLQRSTNFTFMFSSSPLDKAGTILDKIGGVLFNNNLVSGADLGINNIFGDLLGSIISKGANKVIQNLGINKILIGATNNRIVQSILGEFITGQSLVKFFGMNRTNNGMYVKEVNLPSTTIKYAYDHIYASPSIRLYGRELPPLVVTFRVDSESLNYKAMKEWMDSIIDPITGLVAFIDEVDADIQVNYHDRNGIPHTTHYFQGCIPVEIIPTVLSYEKNNEVLEFNVVFAYRQYTIGNISMTDALKWLTARATDRFVDDLNLPDLSSKVMGNGSGSSIGPPRYPSLGSIFS